MTDGESEPGQEGPPVLGPQDEPTPVGTRVEELLAQMTLEEKVAQLGGVWSTDLAAGTGFSATAAAEKMPLGTGHITRIAASTGLRPDGVAALYNQIQRWLLNETRLGIPAILHEEATAGFCARDAVQFPQAIGLAATWNRDLLTDVADHIRSEMVAVGARQALAPVLDIARDPCWGRVEETYGEDPVLAGELGAAYVRGIQGTVPGGTGLLRGVVATAKHFVGYGASDGGLNHGPVTLGSRELREVFAEPFAAAIRDAGLGSVMNSYASVDGLPCASSRVLLTELLRDELGFTGSVVADYFSVDLLRTHHRVAPTKGVAGAKALLAGLDVELPALDCFAELPGLVTEDIVPEVLIDLAVRRVLRHKFELGLFDSPYVDEESARLAFGTTKGRDLARRAAAESIVLLANDGVLPLDAGSLTSIALIGPAADDRRLLEGDYHYPAHLEILMPSRTDASSDEASDAGPDGVAGPPDRAAGGAELLPRSTGTMAPGEHYPDIVTPLAGLRSLLLGTDVSIVHERGCDVNGSDTSGFDAAVAAAAGADVAVVCLGERSGLTLDATVGEARDASNLDLTGVQGALLAAVAATGTPVITVVISGRVHTLASVEDQSGATLLAWVPGIEGGAALADVLLGHVAPSGRLPVSLPRSVGQIPVHYNHRAGGGRSQFWGDYVDGPAAALHPFGFGLSTTTFEYSEVTIAEGTTTTVTTVTVSLINTGSVPGDEVIQCYVHDETASVSRPERQLVGFTRVTLEPHQPATVTFAVHPSRLAFYDEEFDFVCEPGTFRVEVGGWAGAPAVTATWGIAGDIAVFGQHEVIPTAVEVLLGDPV